MKITGSSKYRMLKKRQWQDRNSHVAIRFKKNTDERSSGTFLISYLRLFRFHAVIYFWDGADFAFLFSRGGSCRRRFYGFLFS